MPEISRNHSAPAPAPTRVINAGKGGHNTRDLLARYEADAAVHRPDLLILGVGTNDALNSANSVPLHEYRENARKLIHNVRACGASIMVLTPLPCMDEYVLERHDAGFFRGETPSARVARYVEALKTLCASERVPVVDLYGLFLREAPPRETAASWLCNPANSGKRDGVHPTDAGYEAITTAIIKLIRCRALPHQRVVCFGDSITYGEGASTGKSYPARLQKLLEA